MAGAGGSGGGGGQVFSIVRCVIFFFSFLSFSTWLATTTTTKSVYCVGLITIVCKTDRAVRPLVANPLASENVKRLLNDSTCYALPVHCSSLILTLFHSHRLRFSW